MSEFINPYHFVPPLREPKHPTSKLAVCNTLVNMPKAGTAFRPDAAELLHDRYVPLVKTVDSVTESATFSGRIDCTLKTVSPCVFGNRHRKVKVNGEDTTIVENFQIDGNAAIAGTALKGMLSSIVEMASGSAMRVLGNHAMSIRSSMKQSRSALGIIVESIETKGDGSERVVRRLLPLILPTFRFSNTEMAFVPTDGSSNTFWQSILQKMQPSGLQLCGTYVTRNPANAQIYYPNRTVVALEKKFIRSVQWGSRAPNATRDSQLVKLDRNTGRPNLIRPAKFGHRPDAVVKAWDPKEKDLVPGILRTLDTPRNTQGKADRDLANSEYSLFIPISLEWIDEGGYLALKKIGTALPLLDAEVACSTFETIVSHELSTAPADPGRSATSLRQQKKFALPKGRKRKGGISKLKAGDIVYFVPDSDGTVQSVSVAGIWREGVRWLWNEKDKDYSLLHHPDQRPMDPQRTQVTMAEKLFGWVMEGISETDEQKPGELPNGYKGRVTVSDAICTAMLNDVQLANSDSVGEKELKGYFPMPIQGSPKLPCPEFYFSGGTKKIRAELFDRTNSKSTIRMQGWKFYVIDPATISNNHPQRWKTSCPGSDIKQKSWVRPVKCGTEFKFHVTFDNLTHEELQLLCYALKPDENFCHRLGYGKPVGLGVVSIQPNRIQVVNRKLRYEQQENLLKSTRFNLESNTSVGEMSATHARSIPDQHQVIVVSGRAVKVSPTSTVSYPVRPGQNAEEKLYEWFVTNRERSGDVSQKLTPLLPDRSIPALTKEKPD